MKKQKGATREEIWLRRKNAEMQNKLIVITINCDFILANSDNNRLKMFAGTIKRIADADK